MAGYDLTFTPVKSVSALWALAPLEVAKTIEDCHHRPSPTPWHSSNNTPASPGMGTNGVAQVDTTGFLAAAFDHRDSRAGDPNLHTHVAISTRSAPPGPTASRAGLRWTANPSTKPKSAASELYNTLCETNLTQALGLVFADAADTTPAKRPVREITGIPTELLDLWSTRRSAIEHRVGQLAKDFQTQHRREPTAVELLALSQQATLETRHAKHEPRSLAEQRHTGAPKPSGARKLPRPRHPHRLTHRKSLSRSAPTVTEEWVQQQAAAVIATVSAGRATWQINHVRAEVSRLLRYTDQPHTPALADRIVTTALGEHSIALTDHADTEHGRTRGVRRRDGSSVYTRHDTTVYTSADILAAEHRILAAAARSGGHVVDDTSIDLAAPASRTPATESSSTTASSTSARHGHLRGPRPARARPGRHRQDHRHGVPGRRVGQQRRHRHRPGADRRRRRSPRRRPRRPDRHHRQTRPTRPAPAKRPRTAADDPARTWFDHIGPKTLIIVDEAGNASTSGLDAVIGHALAPAPACAWSATTNNWPPSPPAG